MLVKDIEKKRVFFNVLSFIERGLAKVIEKCWDVYHERKPRYMTYPRNIHRAIWACFRVFSLVLSSGLQVVKFLRKKVNGLAGPANCGAGDIVLLVDASWNDQCFEVYGRARKNGALIVVVVHDVIPLSRPEFFADVLVRDFARWFEWAVNNTDGIVAVSKRTANQVMRYMPDYLHTDVRPWVDYSYNGEGLPASGDVKLQSLASVFVEGDGRRYLCVGTLEPRKNHVYILDAFDLAWRSGVNVKLILVGKQGWRCADLLERINSHQQLGKNLIWMSEVNDAELHTLYSKVDELIMASFDEGFGLPIVESLSRKTPVLAADIEVFREFGSDGIRFFDLNSPSELASLLATRNQPTVPDDWTWPNWAESTRMLFEKVIDHSNAPRNA